MTKLWCSVLGCWENGVTPTAQNTFAGTASIIFMTNSGRCGGEMPPTFQTRIPGSETSNHGPKSATHSCWSLIRSLTLGLSQDGVLPPLPWVTPIHCLSEESLQRGIFSQDRRLFQEGVPGHPGGVCPTMHYLCVTPLMDTGTTVAFRGPSNPRIEHAASTQPQGWSVPCPCSRSSPETRRHGRTGACRMHCPKSQPALPASGGSLPGTVPTQDTLNDWSHDRGYCQGLQPIGDTCGRRKGPSALWWDRGRYPTALSKAAVSGGKTAQRQCPERVVGREKSYFRRDPCVVFPEAGPIHGDRGTDQTLE